MDTEAGEQVGRIEVAGSLYRCALNSDNDMIAVASQSPNAVLIASASRLKITHTLDGFLGVPCSCLFSHSGQQLVTGDNSGYVLFLLVGFLLPSSFSIITVHVHSGCVM